MTKTQRDFPKRKKPNILNSIYFSPTQLYLFTFLFILPFHFGFSDLVSLPSNYFQIFFKQF